MVAENTLSSRALPSLLALTLVACGGRYSETRESEGGAGGRGSSPPSAQAGRSSGSGGAAGTGGLGMGGVGVGVGGGPVGTAGMATGSGGGSIGVPIDTRLSCQAYCEAFAKLCPDRDPYACSKTCYSEQLGSPCPETLRQAYECVTEEATAADSCDAAVVWASKACGAVDGWPLDCDEPQCELDLSGDPKGCHAVTTCDGVQSDLYCTGSGPVSCTCWVDGRNVADLMTALPSSKAACGDAALQALCLAYAQP